MKAATDRPRIIIKKKKVSHGGHHGGAWKVAYADFVTAMMALFIVLWLLTQADVQTRSQIARYFRDPGVLSGGTTAIPPTSAKELVRIAADDVLLVQDQAVEELARQTEQEMLEKQTEKVKQLLDKQLGENPDLAELKDQVQVRLADQGLLIDLVDDAHAVLFATGSASLQPPLVSLLKKLASVLGELPNEVEIGGHTDSRPYVNGSAKSNWDLSYERAAAAQRVLEENGLRAGQVSRVLAHADSDLLNPEDPLDPKNRRLSILLARRLPLPERRKASASLFPKRAPGGPGRP